MASERGVVQSLDRALSILDALAVSDEGLSLADIASRTSLPKSTAHRLLATLGLRGFVVRDVVTGAYRLGPKNLPNLAPGPEVHDVLVDLAADSGETANLGVLVGREVLYLDRADSPQALRWQLGVGTRVPAHCSGLGKAILAFTDQEQVVRRALAGRLARYTERTTTDARALREELAVVRRRGFSLDNEEFMDGVRCVAVPILGPGGEAVASISLAGPAFRLSLQAATAQVPRLVAGAGRVAKILAERRTSPFLAAGGGQ